MKSWSFELRRGVSVSLVFVVLLLASATNLIAQRDWTRKAAMPTARSHSGVGAEVNYVYVVGGETSPYFPTGVFERYSIADDTWETLPSKPNPAYDFAMAVNNQLVYCASGTDGVVLFDFMEIYNPSAQTWDSADLPDGMEGVLGASMIAMDGKLYLIGGGNSYLEGSPDLYRFDPGVGWTQLASMNEGRLWFWAGKSPGRIYVVGGYSTSYPGRIMPGVEMYDAYLDAWFSLPSLPSPTPSRLMGMGGVVYGDTLYVYGGTENGTTPLTSGWKLAPLWGGAPQWQAVTGLPSPARMHCGSATGLLGSNVALHIVGGYAPSTEARRYLTLDILDQLILGPVLPTPVPTSAPTRTVVPTSSPTPTITPTSGPSGTPTYSPTVTRSPTTTRTPTITRTPTLTPTPVPTDPPYPLEINIHTNMEYFRPDDHFLLLTEIDNRSNDSHYVDEYIVLEVWGSYYFYPRWRDSIDSKELRVKAFELVSETVLDFIWPGGAGSASGLTFYMVLTKYNHIDIILSNIDYCVFGFGE